MLKMLIAGDEPVIIRGLQMLIDWAQLGIEICATCENGADALREIFAQSPDLALLDISMPGKTGIEILKALHTAQSRTKVIFISGFQDFSYAHDALSYGAVDYLLKPVKKDDLLRAVRLQRATKRRFTSALDLLYCAAFALLTFLFALRIGGGELRLYMLCSAFFGAVSYFTLCARLFRPLWAFWAEVLFSFARLAAAPLRWLQKVYGKLAKLCKRYFLFSRNRLIIKSYERSARFALRRTRKKEEQRHGSTGQKREKAHQFSHGACHRDPDCARGGAAHSPQSADRIGAESAHGTQERSRQRQAGERRAGLGARKSRRS